MDKFELYLIKNIKRWSDSVNRNKDSELRLIALNVYDELMDALVQYRLNK